MVQLPQTIWFGSNASLADTRDWIKKQGNFTLLVRDKVSLELAHRELDVQAMLCPDMAFALGPLHSEGRPSARILFLLRTDKEQQAGWGEEIRTVASHEGVDVLDWPDEHEKATRALLRALGKVNKLLPSSMQIGEIMWRSLSGGVAQRLLSRGLAVLTRGQVVVTDRLHGHILCVLLAKPHVVLDNSYGKVFAYLDAWTGGLPFVRRAGSPAEALAQAEDLLAAYAAGPGTGGVAV
jgi:pyruvyl transferase EpsO